MTLVYMLVQNTFFSTNNKGLVTNYGEGGGLQNGRGACEVLPLQKRGGGGKSFSRA